MGFLKELYSSSKSASWGRVHASLTLGTLLIWCSYLVSALKLPADLDKLGNVGTFLVAGGGVVSLIYGLSKGLDTYKDIKKPEA